MTPQPPRLFEWQPCCIDKPCIGKIDICPCDGGCDTIKECVEHKRFLIENPEVAKKNAEIEVKNFNARMDEYLRSRPAPAPEPFPLVCPDCEGRMFKTLVGSENENHPCGRIVVCSTCNGSGLITQEQHDAAVAAQAWEEVLTRLQKWRYAAMNGTTKSQVWIQWNRETELIDELRIKEQAP